VIPNLFTISPKQLKNYLPMKNLLGILLLSALAFSCQTKKEENPETAPKDSTAAFEAERSAFYANLKAPAEVAAQLEATAADFNPSLMHDPKMAASYEGDKLKAAGNLGIYLSDLNYSVAYKKSANTKELFAAAAKLSKSVGIDQGVLDFLMKRYDENLEKNDSAKAIVYQLLDKTTSGLQGPESEKLVGIAMSAYQIENLHLALGLIETYPKDMLPSDARTQILVPVYKLVLSQQQNIENILGFLKSIKETENPNYAYHVNALEELIGVYKKLNVEDKIANNNGLEIMNDATVHELHEKVKAIRDKVTSLL
jgi:hypothetical protein